MDIVAWIEGEDSRRWARRRPEGPAPTMATLREGFSSFSVDVLEDADLKLMMTLFPRARGDDGGDGDWNARAAGTAEAMQMMSSNAAIAIAAAAVAVGAIFAAAVSNWYSKIRE